MAKTILRSCQTCGNQFTDFLCRDRKFCSPACFQASRKPPLSKCECCGEAFSPYGAKARFCSRKCTFLGMRTQEEKICSVCNKRFSSSPSHNRKFCSKECHITAQQRGDYKRGPQKPERIHSCLNCGKETIKTPSRDRKGNRCTKVFCSRPCYDAYRKVHTCKGKPRKEVLTRTCKGCGAEFRASHEGLKQNYCSWPCRVADRKAKPKNCISCGCLFTPVKMNTTSGKMISYNDGKTCSHACYIMNIKTDEVRKKKISLAFTGENHPLWKGGTSYFGTLSSRGPNWKSQRKLALKRDKHICQNCGIDNDTCKEKYGRTLDVDHIIPYHQHTSYKKANRLSNLITLCASCHRHMEAKKEGSQMVLPIMEHGGNHSGYIRGEKVNTAKLKEFQVMGIRKLAASGEKIANIISLYGISKGQCHQIISGRSWKHLPILGRPEKRGEA